MSSLTKDRTIFIVAALILICCWAVVVGAQSVKNVSTRVEDFVVVQHVTAIEASKIIEQNPEIIVLDVRTPIEFRLGHIAEAINVNYYSFSFASKLKALDRNKTYLVHCQTGVRSDKTMPIMLEAGFTNLIHMDGGYSDWKNAKLPTS